MIYKGYTGITEVDEDSGELFGSVIGLRDVITFVGSTVEEARKSFEESIDYYLKSCQETGREPDRPFAGQFQVRIDPETHQRLAILSGIHKLTLNEIVAKALKDFVASNELWANEEIIASLSSDPVKRNQERLRAAAIRKARNAKERIDDSKRTG
jgi:predicted HicB family RNase H-like nuclease